MDNQYIRGLRIQKKSVVKKLYAAVCMVLVAALLVSATSYAWLVLSQAPEVSNVTTTIGANGNLEIALGKNIGESAIGDSSAKNDVLNANRTWGNLIDLTDESYGLQAITLRPAILNSAGGAINMLHPLAAPVYGADGRVQYIYANNMFAGTYNGSQFITTPNDYGVHGIGTTQYHAPGVEGTFGPLSQRQEIFYYAQNNLWTMTSSYYTSLCTNYQGVLMAYCTDGTGVSASDFDLDKFSTRVSDFVSAANEELRLVFTLLAASEATSADNYFMALELLEQEWPDYETIRGLVSSAIQAEEAENVGEAIAELRAFQTAHYQLKSVIASGTVDSSDGYSIEEIAQTVGLIFDLDKTSFSETSQDYWSKVIPDLRYRRYVEGKYWWWDYFPDNDFAVNDLTNSVQYSDGQDNDSREATAYEIANTNTFSLYRSLPLAELDTAIAGLYAKHWAYWDEHAEDYQRVKDDAEALQTLLDAEVYAGDDSSLESIRAVMTDTIEVLRQYTLWSIAYCACDGRVPDDAYHRILEIASSSEYIHPRTAYQTLCNYGVTPQDELANMVITYEKLEDELLFLQTKSGSADVITWSEINEELQRVFGSITHQFYFFDDWYDRDYFSSYSVEDMPCPTTVMVAIREEIENCEAALGSTLTKGNTKHWITYRSLSEDNYQPWAQALGLLTTFGAEPYPFEYGEAEYTLADRPFSTEHSMWYAQGFQLSISVGVGSEDNFNESGLTVRQTRFKDAQEKISYYQNQLITAALNPDKDMVTLLMQIIAGADSVSLVTISEYLDSLQQQLEYGEAMMYQAALAMAASDYAEDNVYRYAYSDRAPTDAAGMIALLQSYDFDGNVLNAFAQRMELLNNQKALLNQSLESLKAYQNSDTGALTAEHIPASEAVALLDSVLDTGSLTLYGYVAESGSDEDSSPSYVRTVLYTGYGSSSVQVNGNQVTIAGREPVTVFGNVYLSLGRSLSGGMLALAKSQAEDYSPPTGSMSASDIMDAENGENRRSYALGEGETLYTLNLRTADTPYALATNLWNYTGNTNYISAGQTLVDLYGYSIDLSFRTNAANSDLLLQTEAVDRVYDDGDPYTDTTMGAGSYMEFTILSPSYSIEMAKEYMSCLRVVFTDTNTGYIYGYAALEMAAAEVIGVDIKAPLRLYDKNTGLPIEGDTSQYLCHLEQNLEENLTVYVYLDGAKASQSMADTTGEQSLSGTLNLQFCSSADLKPAFSGNGDTANGGTQTPSNPSDPTNPSVPEESTPTLPDSGEEVVDTGNMTDNISWMLYNNGLLKFEGTGAMPDFSADSDAPWYAYREDISTVEISEGITYLGLGNFAALDYAKIIIPESVVAIVGHNGWGGQYKTVQYAGSEQLWNSIAIFSPNNTLIDGVINAEKSDAQLLYSGDIEATSISWTLSADGILTIRGSGAMPDWSDTQQAPWDQYKTSIKHIVITEGITSVGSYAFDGLTNVLTAKVASTVTKLGAYAFSECEKLLAVAIDDDSSMSEIEEYCFNNCTSLRHINIPDSVTTLGEAAFQGCAVLDHVMINGVTNLGNYVFFGCESLSSISLAEGVTVIPDYAFGRCFSLDSLTIPSSVRIIQSWAFYDGSGDSNAVYYAGTSEQWNTIFIDYHNTYFDNAEFIFEGEIVASGSVNTDISWVLDDAGILIINGTGNMPSYEDGVGIQDQDIAEWVHEDYNTVIISDGITSIGEYAFLWADKLTTVVLTTSVTNISWNAFDGCDLLITMYIIGYEDAFEPALNGSSYPSNITFVYLS